MTQEIRVLPFQFDKLALAEPSPVGRTAGARISSIGPRSVSRRLPPVILWPDQHYTTFTSIKVFDRYACMSRMRSADLSAMECRTNWSRDAIDGSFFSRGHVWTILSRRRTWAGADEWKQQTVAPAESSRASWLAYPSGAIFPGGSKRFARPQASRSSA